MARRRGGTNRYQSNIWAGFVDALSGLLLIMVFVLSAFTVTQLMLNGTIDDQNNQLSSLESRIAQISEALGASRRANVALETELANTNNQLSETESHLAALQFQYNEQSAQIASFEEQVASLISKNQELTGSLAQAETERDAALDEKTAAQLALASARSEIDAEAEAARLAAARADMLEAMIADFQTNQTANGAFDDQLIETLILAQSLDAQDPLAQDSQLSQELEQLTKLERDKIAEQVALEYLREKLQNSNDEMIAMTLALEEERKNAEETLSLLAAIEAEKTDLSRRDDFTEAEKNAALLELANREIALLNDNNADSARRLALLNQQTAQLRAQLSALQNLLDQTVESDRANQVQIETMGSSLNAALARLAAEERERANSLESYRSEFFGRLRDVLSDYSGIRVVGDRFVFASEVLFPAGSARLSPEGEEQLGIIAQLVNELSTTIPNDINWILRIDGHTDSQPITQSSEFADNWELSQARALNVARYMINAHNVDPFRLAPTGFGEYHPITNGTDAASLAQNRRIELKLTEQ